MVECSRRNKETQDSNNFAKGQPKEQMTGLMRNLRGQVVFKERL